MQRLRAIRFGGHRAGALALTAALAIAASTAAARAGDETVVIDALQWAKTTSGEDLRWPDAVQFCAERELDGHADWRLPSMAELKDLHDPAATLGIRAPFAIDTCCLWSGESLVDRPAADGDSIAGTPDMYHWGFMFDGGHDYYAVHVFEDGQALCVRDAGG
jgi:hypothetical protein